ncbi:hypothetical protein L2E82_02111 [Cichorium intybus]|uniref:Uncharacterized protein n=1 Tax=Cichorium intybus TaxID=13427 RepID=A0ACB9H1T5_CICIN|nr:hypothetical protein L2E82_02111 [Cichorium intybus]
MQLIQCLLLIVTENFKLFRIPLQLIEFDLLFNILKSISSTKGSRVELEFIYERCLSLSQLKERDPELISCGRPAYSNYHIFACLDPSTVDYSHPSVAGYYRFSTEQVDLKSEDVEHCNI